MSLFIDLALVASLLAAAAYGVLLSQRLNRLMKILRELEPAITAFSEAVDKSQDSALGLRSAAIQLAEEVGQAKGRKDDAPLARGRANDDTHRSANNGDKSDLVRGFFSSLQERTNA